MTTNLLHLSYLPHFTTSNGRCRVRNQEGVGKRIVAGLFFLGALIAGILLFELLDTSCGIDKFLLSGKKRMAGRTNLDSYLVLNGTEFELVAAGAHRVDLMIFRMDIWFHGKHSLCKDSLDKNNQKSTIYLFLSFLQRKNENYRFMEAKNS